MSPVRRFGLADDTEVAAVVAGLEARAALVPESDEIVERTPYDTFDWRLYDEGSIIELQRRGDQPASIVWRSLDRAEVLGRFEGDDVPRFAWDLDPGPATTRLASILEMRALIPLTTVVTRATTCRLLDDEHKTVARLIAEEVVEGYDHPLAAVFTVAPLRGYEREARALTHILDAQVLLRAGAEDIVVAALRREGFAPGAYSSKLRTDLDPARTAADIWIEVLRLLFAAMRANEAGTREDLDSEFLHDFRVAVRRTRTVLGEAKGIFDADELAHFRTEFKWLGQATSPTRDLDVFLLDTADFADDLVPERRADLEAFVAYLHERQRDAHLALVEELDSGRYSALVDRWSRFLDEPRVPTDAEPDGGRPAPGVAGERIAKAHRRLVRDGRRIDESSEPERLHDLRKDAKRLRYLLECFGSLFPSEEIAPVIKQLKGVQDVLGAFQDGQVQSAQLESFAQDMLDRGDANAAAVMVIGLLVEQTEQRGHAARVAFADRFAAFDRKPVRTAVHQLRHDHVAETDPHPPEEPPT